MEGLKLIRSIGMTMTFQRKLNDSNQDVLCGVDFVNGLMLAITTPPVGLFLCHDPACNSDLAHRPRLQLSM